MNNTIISETKCVFLYFALHRTAHFISFIVDLYLLIIIIVSSFDLIILKANEMSSTIKLCLIVERTQTHYVRLCFWDFHEHGDSLVSKFMLILMKRP